MITKFFQSLFLFTLLLVGCGNTPSPERPTAPQSQRVFTSDINDKATFQAFSKTIAEERFTKFIVDLKSGQLYFFDVNVFPMHVDFVFKGFYNEEMYPHLIEQFNRNYEAEKPEFLLCYLVHHESLDLWTFTFWEGDKMTAEHVLLAHEKLKKHFYEGAKVLFRPDSTLHEQVAKKLEGKLETITNDKIYKSREYHAFNTGERVGRLRVIRTEEDAKHFNPDEVLILSVTLPDLTVVSGVISETFSTPLSHVALRARAWDIPHVGLKGAAERFAAHEGEVVFFSAQDNSYELRRATPDEISAWEKRRSEKRLVKIPESDLSQREIKFLDALGVEDTSAYGAKSANLGEVYLQGGLYEVPQGFALPIHYYHEHIGRHGVDKKISALLANTVALNDQRTRAALLEEIRREILEAPLDDALLAEVMSRVSALGLAEGKGVFVRSSTTAEDLPGFNGAGLYDTVPNVRSREDIARAVRVVWASVWNLRAFEERTFFGIDHASVYAGVLLQVGVNATAAGVLVTKNLYSTEEKETFTINAKSGLGIRVVEGRRVPEQLLFDTSNEGIKVISRSDDKTMLVFDENGGVHEVDNPSAGQPVLTDEMVVRLGFAALSIVDRYPSTKPLDIEWLFVGGTLHIVQVRPFVGE